jgi:hypothetical protein
MLEIDQTFEQANAQANCVESAMANKRHSRRSSPKRNPKVVESEVDHFNYVITQRLKDAQDRPRFLDEYC